MGQRQARSAAAESVSTPFNVRVHELPADILHSIMHKLLCVHGGDTEKVSQTELALSQSHSVFRSLISTRGILNAPSQITCISTPLLHTVRLERPWAHIGCTTKFLVAHKPLSLRELSLTGLSARGCVPSTHLLPLLSATAASLLRLRVHYLHRVTALTDVLHAFSKRASTKLCEIALRNVTFAERECAQTRAEIGATFAETVAKTLRKVDIRRADGAMCYLLPYLPMLNALTVGGQGVCAMGWNADTSVALRVLGIDVRNLTPNIHILSIHDSPLADTGALLLLQKLPLLEYVAFVGTLVSANTFREVLRLHKSTLRGVSFAGLPDLNDNDMEMLAECDLLQEIRLRRCSAITDNGVKQICAKRGPNVAAFDLRECFGIGEDSLKEIAKTCRAVTEIGVNASSKHALATLLRGCGSTLRSLHVRIRGPKIGKVDVQSLVSQFCTGPSLESVTIE